MNVRLTAHSEEILRKHLAQGHFRSPEELIERALESLFEGAERSAVLDLAEFDAALDALSEGSEGLPVLPLEATSRPGIYGDHD